MNYPQVKFDFFEGPLDLLLHLVARNEMSIFNINISEIASQYNEEVKNLGIELNVAADFIHMASYLLYLKSRMLLPHESLLDEEEYSVDEEQFLFAQKLIEYSYVKYLASFFDEKYKKSSGYLTRGTSLLLDNPDDVVETADVYSLASVYFETTVVSKRDMVVKTDKSLVNSIIKDAYDYMMAKSRCYWSGFLSFCSSKKDFAISFFSMLELVRQGKIKASQDKCFGEIVIERLDSDGSK